MNLISYVYNFLCREADVSNWTKVEVLMEAKGTDHSSRLQLTTTKKGVIWLDQVSAMPLDTHKGHGYRNDLFNMIADLKPGFIRFPGGSFVEGEWLVNAFRWKETVGPWEERPGHFGDVWKYWTDDGLGYFEYLQAFVSEHAVTGQDAGRGNLLKALAEAGFLIGLERNSDAVEMVVNFGNNRVTLKISIDGLEQNKIQKTGSAKTILTSSNVMDENIFNGPKKVAPVTCPLENAGNKMNVILAPYSLNSQDLLKNSNVFQVRVSDYVKKA
ncbi:Alpha-L-arabinofuranosidase 1 [Abeliophyllum distichum]|uniref:non-reducing end alpha-L-arabinofuranosidase n=1 Tax=Abeliophyllum distichum TaxID=126358 RepID=A0ABD1QKX2_9LAMI